MTELSVSILGYEPKLEENVDNIFKIIKQGVNTIHIDIMRKKFIKDKNTFVYNSLKRIYDEFSDYITCFDYHIMSYNPHSMIKIIKKIIPKEKRINHYITIPIEAYRSESLGKYYDKEKDLLNTEYDAVNKQLGVQISKTLKSIQKSGFKSGISLEPNTSIDNLTDNILLSTDLILIMSVSSGKGGQDYIQKITEKIEKVGELKKFYPNIKLSVDGGIKKETINYPIMAGADFVVIGSAITKEQDLEKVTNEFLDMLRYK